MKIYAIWKYDRPPYLLCGEVVKSHLSGMVEVKGYEGFLIRPYKFVLDIIGELTVDKLQKLRNEYLEEEKELLAKYRRLGLETIGE